MRKQDDSLYLKNLNTLEFPTGSLGRDTVTSHLARLCTGRSTTAPIFKVVLEADGVLEDNQEFREHLASLTLVVPEVVVTRLMDDGVRWQ